MDRVLRMRASPPGHGGLDWDGDPTGGNESRPCAVRASLPAGTGDAPCEPRPALRNLPAAAREARLPSPCGGRPAASARRTAWPSATTRSIIGGGHNGLVSAAYLARAGLKTLVLEQRHVLGGAAVTEEIFPGFRFSRLQLRRVAAAARDHPRPRAAAARPRHPAARRHVHAAPQGRGPAGRRRRLPVAGQRPRPDDPRAPPLVGDRRRGVRGIRPADGRDGPLHQADPGDHAARPDRASTRGRCCRWPASPGAFQQLPERQQAVFVQLMTMSAADFLDQWFETDPLKATMSRVGDHRHVPGRQEPGHGLRPAPPLHGRDRRRVPGLGHPEGRDRRRSRNAIGSAARALGAEIRTEAPGRPDHRQAAAGRSASPSRSGEEIQADVVLSSVDARRTFLGLLEPGTLDAVVRGGGPPVQVPRLVGQGQPGRRPAARLHAACPGVGEHLRGAISFSPSIDEMEQRLRRREVRPLQRASRTST